MTDVHSIEIPIPFPIKAVTCYYIRDSLPTLIDTGINAAQDFEVIASTLRGLGESVRGLRRIIATHGHGDHVGLAGKLARESGAEVYMHPWDKPLWPLPDEETAHSVSESFSRFLMGAGVPPHLVRELIQLMLERLDGMFSPLDGFTPLADGDSFMFDDFELQVLHTPGHSPGSVCLLNTTNGSLFSGDAMLEEITYNPPLEADRVPPTYVHMHEYLRSLQILESAPIRTVFPGHGFPYSNHTRRIKAFRRFHELRRQSLVHFMQEAGPGLTTFDLMNRLFPAATGIEIYYRVAAVHVHLEALAKEGVQDVPVPVHQE